MADNPSVRAGTVGGTIVVVADEIVSPYTGDTAQAQGVKILDGVANSATPAHVTAAGMLSTFVGNNGTVSVSGTPSVFVTNSGTVSVTGTVDTELPAAAALADNTANPTVPGVGAFGHVWDGATWDRLPGNSAAGALVHQTNQGTVSVSNTVTVTANGGTILGQAGTVTALQGTSPWVTHVNNNGTVTVSGAVDTELPAAATLADNTANPSTPSVGVFPHWYDGATWDRAKGDSTDGLLVNLGANNDVTVTGTVSISGGTALGQAGTVTALQGTSPWVVHVNNNGTVNGGTLLGQAGTVTALQGTSPWVTHQNNNGTVSVSNTVTVTANGGTLLGQAGTVTALQGTSPWVTHQNNNGTVSVSNTVTVTANGGTLLGQAGTVTALQGTSPWVVHVNNNGTVNGGTLLGQAGTVTALQGTNPWVTHVNNNGTVSVSNTVTVDTELPAAAALADNTSNPTVPGVGAFGLVWDGATWDRMPGNSATGVLTHQNNNGTVSVSNTVTVTANGGTILGQAGTVTALQGTSPWVVHVNNNGTVNGGTLLGQAGTVTALQGTSPWVTHVNNNGTVSVTGTPNVFVTNSGTVTAGSAVIGLGYTLGGTSINLTASGTVVASVASRVLYVTHEAFTVQGGTITITARNGNGGGTLWGPMQFSPTGGISASQGIMDGGLYETASGSAVYYEISGAGTVGGRIRFARLA